MSINRRRFIKTLTSGTVAVSATALLGAEAAEALENVNAIDNSIEKGKGSKGVPPGNIKPTPTFSKPKASLSSMYFQFEVKGIYGPVPGCTSVSGGDLTLTIEETTDGDKPDYREYTYGSHDYEDLTLTVTPAPDNVKLLKWATEAIKSGETDKGLYRDCALHLLARDKSTVMRSVNYFGVYPLSMTAATSDAGGELKTIVISCSVDRVDESKG
ncbi:MAG: phage tail protein [Myxococcales bacterium]|nr:phage tail protein [Myxococcales bacterium]